MSSHPYAVTVLSNDCDASKAALAALGFLLVLDDGHCIGVRATEGGPLAAAYCHIPLTTEQHSAFAAALPIPGAWTDIGERNAVAMNTMTFIQSCGFLPPDGYVTQ